MHESRSGMWSIDHDLCAQVILIGVQRVKEVDAAIKGALEREAKARVVEVR